MSAAVLMTGIEKRFPGVVANAGVNFSAAWGEVHALLGENGAGKTTLMSVLAGLYRPDAGQILIDGRLQDFHSPGDAIKAGVGMVYQHYKLVASQTVTENIMLGMAGLPFHLNAKRMHGTVRQLSERYGLHVQPEQSIWQLSVGEQQRVEILKALHRGARILVLDEPTAVLTPQESADLMMTLQRIAGEGRTVILISHKLEEIKSVADRVTVLRAGKVVGEAIPMAATSTRELAEMMVGAQVPGEPTASRTPPGPLRLALKGLCANDDRGLPALKNINLELCSGEILGIAGVAGNGQRELSEAVTGMRPVTSGTIELGDRDMTSAGVRQLVDAGVAHVPQDRLGEGLVGNLSLKDNAILHAYHKPPVARGPFLSKRSELAFTEELLGRFHISGGRPDSIARTLSGGQLQRFLLARELAFNPAVIVAAHPTRGLDVAATRTVQEWLLRARDQGSAVLLISEDLDEVLLLSDRIAVLYDGAIAGIMPAAQADRSQIGLLMAGAADISI